MAVSRETADEWLEEQGPGAARAVGYHSAVILMTVESVEVALSHDHSS